MRVPLGLLLMFLILGLAVPGCGVILGDDEHWGFPLFRMGASLMVGLALGYGAHRLRMHGRRDERRDDRPWNKDDPQPKPKPPGTPS